MKDYQVILDDADKVIDNIAKGFQGSSIRITKIKDDWILESSEFETCSSVDEVLKKANILLDRINVLLGVYPYITTPIKAKYINYTKPDGKRSRRIWGYIQVNVYDENGVNELAHLINSDSFGTTIILKSYHSPAVNELLAIIGLPPMKWATVYDVIEFFGDDDGIAKLGYATKKEVRKIRQTANYYRHLGRRKKELLPGNPPSLRDAIAFTYNVIKKWLSNQEINGS